MCDLISVPRKMKVSVQEISIPEIIIVATDNTSQAEVDMAKEEVKEESAKRECVSLGKIFFGEKYLSLN